MKGILSLIVFVHLYASVYAQNLVSNASFENYSACPSSNSSEVYLAIPWIEVEATADYYACSALDNSYLARTGGAYMGVSAYRPSWSETYREYIGIYLNQTLVAGVEYYVEYWVRLRPSACWASDGMGAYFSQGQPVSPNFGGMLNVNAQIMNPQYRMLDARNNWMKICGKFIASGNENFMTIGSFRDDAQSTFVELAGCPNQSFGVHWSYYHIDDVLVLPFDSTVNYFCDDTTVYENPNPAVEPPQNFGSCNLAIPNVFSPNGDGINDKLELSMINLEKWNFKIMNRWGRLVYESNQNSNEGWDGLNDFEEVNDGVYFYILYSEQSRCYQTGTITVLR